MVGLYRAHGEFCASHPWEVIVATLTLTACILSIDTGNVFHSYSQKLCETPPCQDYNAVDVIAMTIIRCVAVLYSYYQFRNLHKLGSKYILGIAGLFTVFSSFVFSSSVINCLTGDVSDLKDALFCFLLLIDLSKAALLAQFALSASSQEEVKHNIARGMAHLGPSLTLDTIVETLVVSVGTLSGIRRLEILCYFACLSVLVNYIVFMTFYPSCLSLILELARSDPGKTPSWHRRFKAITELKEHGQKPNPVLQRVKMIMSGGLVFVHLHSRWILKEMDIKESVLPLMTSDHTIQLNTPSPAAQGYLLRWITLGADHIVVLILLLALTVKFIFFEDKDEMIPSEVYGLNEKPKVEVERKVPIILVSKEVAIQTDKLFLRTEIKTTEKKEDKQFPEEIRSLEKCIEINNSGDIAEELNDDEIKLLAENGVIQAYQLEKILNNPERGVKIRRNLIGERYGILGAFYDLPYLHYDYSKVMGTCCENVIGYVPIPVGIAGPLLLDGRKVNIPMATTEGCLVASTNRGCRALSYSGVTTRIVADGMARGPVVRFPSIAHASEAMTWILSSENFPEIKAQFDSTSRFLKLVKIHCRIAGRYLFIRFVATTGDAMGMNMISKATEFALLEIQKIFQEMEILSLSGNFCSDKKPAAVNWIEGRGKSVVSEAIISSKVVKNVLKSSVQALIDVNISKNLIGSAVAGSIGGFNAHAANIVTAIYIATGQDPAQNVGSSNCMTLMEPWGEDGEDLYVSCTMPSIEIGTVGGGTQLPPQAACLDIIGARGAHQQCPGENANTLARVVCASVLAGEISLLSALAAGHLVKSHMKHNRSTAQFPTQWQCVG
ncbi:3-hydroxy-3-methylglutaryl-coenzyme A reductase [Halyomorpha halys]|uniref:3-hydroxy-3-methylglutaryl-coenzyme A reductase n=1 Tax=Halyomorpha halys TaxID=286706 RepID=UPI0006D4CCC6|nr:3-hydroxy-3-methylglutaryl-coenzyme A reductase [Halyomorpha halys]